MIFIITHRVWIKEIRIILASFNYDFYRTIVPFFFYCSPWLSCTSSTTSSCNISSMSVPWINMRVSIANTIRYDSVEFNVTDINLDPYGMYLTNFLCIFLSSFASFNILVIFTVFPLFPPYTVIWQNCLSLNDLFFELHFKKFSPKRVICCHLYTSAKEEIIFWPRRKARILLNILS